jgi:hypothetical protein
MRRRTATACCSTRTAVARSPRRSCARASAARRCAASAAGRPAFSTCSLCKAWAGSPASASATAWPRRGAADAIQRQQHFVVPHDGHPVGGGRSRRRWRVRPRCRPAGASATADARCAACRWARPMRTMPASQRSRGWPGSSTMSPCFVQLARQPGAVQQQGCGQRIGIGVRCHRVGGQCAHQSDGFPAQGGRVARLPGPGPRAGVKGQRQRGEHGLAARRQFVAGGQAQDLRRQRLARAGQALRECGLAAQQAGSDGGVVQRRPARAGPVPPAKPAGSDRVAGGKKQRQFVVVQLTGESARWRRPARQRGRCRLSSSSGQLSCRPALRKASMAA